MEANTTVFAAVGIRENKNSTFLAKEVIEEQVAFFMPLYDYLDWNTDITELTLHTDKKAFARILYNLLSNACKYNTNKGSVKITLIQNKLVIQNDSHGIKNPQKVFERFYKESDRGLGIGLHIVDKLCRELGITKRLDLQGNTVTFTLDLTQLTHY